MCSILQVFLVVFLTIHAQAKDSALDTPLNALIPNRLFNQFSDGWQKSLAVIQVKDIFTLPKIYGRQSEIDSRQALETVISEESPNLYKVLVGTRQALKKKHEDNMGKLSKETKDYMKSTLKAFNSFATNMVNKFKQQPSAVQGELSKVYPAAGKLGPMMLETLSEVIKSFN